MTPPKTTAKPITLADLSDADRKALVEEAREASRRNPVDVDGYDELTDREKRIRALMDARDHSRGCPVQTGERLGRVEGYDSRKPPRPDLGEPARDLGVVRCQECGGSTVLDRPLEAALETASLEASPAARPAARSSSDNDSDL